MATLITRKLKPVADYHQWSAAEMSDGDILGVSESLGNREARSVTIESIGGPSTLRLNVVKKIYREYGPNDQHVGLGQGAFRPSPILVREIEEVKDDIIIEENSTQTWLASEIGIKDIKVISKSPGLKITTT